MNLNTKYINSEKTVSLFEGSDKVLFIGDSITHGGGYEYFIYIYYITRFPYMKITFKNKGLSGDSTSGAISRFGWDIFEADANKAVIMFGMNDLGRLLHTQSITKENIHVISGY